MKAITELQFLAAKHGQVIYDICHRNAGWGILWHDERRCKVPPPPELEIDFKTHKSNLRLISAMNLLRAKQGLVIHHYYPTFGRMLREERKRILAEAKVKAS